MCDLVHCEREIRHVVERAAGDDCVKWRRWDELFERHALEEQAFRRDGIDRSDRMAGRGER